MSWRLFFSPQSPMLLRGTTQDENQPGLLVVLSFLAADAADPGLDAPSNSI
jgi:hypothetical protein